MCPSRFIRGIINSNNIIINSLQSLQTRATSKNNFERYKFSIGNPDAVGPIKPISMIGGSVTWSGSRQFTVKNLRREIQWSARPARLKENSCAAHGMFPIPDQCAAH